MSISNLAKQLESVLNQRITISNIGINQQQIIKDSQQAGRQIAQAINQGITQGTSSASSATNKILRDFSELNEAKRKFVDGSELISKEDIADANRFYETVKQAFSEFGQVTVNGKLTDGNLENLRVKIQQVNGELKTTREFMLYLNKSDQYENSFVLADDDTIKTTERLIQHLNEEKNIVNVTGDEIERQKQQLADQEKYYKNLKNEVNNLYNLQMKLLSADELQTAELEKQIKQTKERISYNNKQLDKKGLTDSSLSREVTDLEVKRQKELAIAVAKVRDGISENLTNLKSKWSEQGVLVGEFKTKVEQLEASLSSVGSKGELDNLKGQIQALKTEASNIEQANKIQLSLETGDFETKILGYKTSLEKLGLSSEEVTTKMKDVNTAFNELKTSATGENIIPDNVIAKAETLDNEMSKLANIIKQIKFDNSLTADDLKVEQTVIRLNNQLQANSRYSKEAKNKIKEWITELNKGDVSVARLKQINVEAKKLHSEMDAVNKTGLTFFDQLGSKLGSLSAYISASTLLYRTFSSMKNGISSITALDTALVDLRKTANMTSQELEDFYYASNDVAKQMGVTTEEILNQAAAWSRLGFNTAEQATQMAKYSSMFAMISPGMNIDDATDGLVSMMKAFKIGADDVNEVVDGIMSKVNIIGNTRALNNADIVEFLTRSSSAMAEANNTLEETIALGTAMVEITRDAANAGQVLKTVSMRIRGYDEETEEYIGGIEELSGKIADLTKTASTPGGISLFSDAAKTEYKSTLQLFREISEIYDDLTDKDQAALLEVLAGKRNGQAIAAILNNFDAVEDSLNSMANSAGNAEAEMAIAMDSIEYKLNALKETGTGIAQNLFGREEMKTVVDGLTTVGKAIDWLTDKLGLFGTLGAGAGLFAGIKNVGGCENAHSHCFELPTIICVL